MLKIQEPATEVALSTGVILALLWGIGIMVRGFLVGLEAASWSDWFLQLSLGITVAIALPPLLVNGAVRLVRRFPALHWRSVAQDEPARAHSGVPGSGSLSPR